LRNVNRDGYVNDFCVEPKTTTEQQEMKRLICKRISGLLCALESQSERVRLNLEEENTWCTRKERLVLERNEELEGKEKGRPCFVIGNGPSLQKQNLGHLAKQVTFAMSGFWKHPVVQEWQPKYYCFADPLFFDGTDAMGRFFVELRRSIHTTTFLLPLAGRDAVIKQELIGNAQAYYISFQGALERCSTRGVELRRSVPGVLSVAQFAILSAIYMGCTPIYLIGLDHDWLAQRGADRHFYAGKTVDGHSKAHGDLDRTPYKVDLANVLKLWQGYERLQVMAETHGSVILNATDGGFLDVFPRVTYEQVIANLLGSARR